MKNVRNPFLFLAIVAIPVFGCVSLCKAESNFGIVTIHGKVDTNEVGGEGLYIFSVWGGNKKAWVDAKGDFSVQVLSNSRPQKISVRDGKNKTRALALIFSQGAPENLLDARSTALAVLLGDPELVKDSVGMAQITRVTESKASFKEFVLFLKKNLPIKDLEDLSKDPAYVDLFEACNREIFHEDRSVIKRSLQDAQGQLENLLR